jgi:hypothetical protein
MTNNLTEWAAKLDAFLDAHPIPDGVKHVGLGSGYFSGTRYFHSITLGEHGNVAEEARGCAGSVAEAARLATEQARLHLEPMLFLPNCARRAA